MEVSTVAEVMETLSGAEIVSGERTDEGMHVYLRDGRTLMFVGDFIMCVGVLRQENLQ